MSKTNKIIALDGLRGVAAIFVIFSHITLLLFPYLHMGSSFDSRPKSWAQALFDSPFTFFYKGTSAVMLFFVMSGFVLSYSAVRKGTMKKWAILPKVIIKRYFRLNIPVACSIALCVSLMMLGFFTANLVGPRNDLYNAYTAPLDGMAAIKDAVYGSIILGNGTFNYVLWTINIEFFGSIMVYFLLTCFGGNTASLRMVTAVIAAYGIHSGTPFVWGVGLFAAGVFMATFDVVAGGSAKRKVLSCITLIIGIYLYGFNSESKSYTYVNILLDYANQNGMELTKGFIVSIIGTILIMTCFLISTSPLKILETALFQWLGRLSFSVYLTHSIILAVVAPIIIERFSWSLHSVAICAIVVTSLTLAVSSLFSKYIDQVAIRRSGVIATWILEVVRINRKSQSGKAAN